MRITLILPLLILTACVDSTGGNAALGMAASDRQKPNPEVMAFVQSRIEYRYDPQYISRSDIDRKVYRAVEYLRDEFSLPIARQQVTLEIRPRSPRNAHTVYRANGARVVLGVLDLERRPGFLVHELFHALYQDRKFLLLGEDHVEKWAAYAEYRYLNRPSTNYAIRQKLILTKGITPREIRTNPYYRIPNAALSAPQEQKKYILYALPLFLNTPEQNRELFYQEWKTSRSVQPVNARKADKSKSPPKSGLKQWFDQVIDKVRGK